jgi:hypothetical protein
MVATPIQVLGEMTGVLNFQLEVDEISLSLIGFAR